MKFKRIMLVTLVLLAILTLGAVSAAEDVSSDGNLTASDDGDIVDVSQDDELGEMSQDDVNIDVNDVDKTETGENFTNIEVTEKEGNFVICTGEDENTQELYREDLQQSDRYVFDDSENVYQFGVSLDDINAYVNSNFSDIVNPGQTVRFVFEYLGGDFIVKSYTVDYTDSTITFDEIGDDADDGVIIWVDDHEFDLNENEDLEAAFAIVTVRNDLIGNITIWYYDENEDKDIYFFNEALENITNKEYDDEFGGYKYKIALNNLTDLQDFTDFGDFKLAFIDGEGNEIDCREYKIDKEGDIVRFIDAADEGPHEERGPFYMNDGLITNMEVVGLETDGVILTNGSLVVFDSVTGTVYFNKTLASMEYNNKRMEYRHDSYRGYYIFKEDLNIPSGRYDLTAVHYDDDYQELENVTRTVILDCDSYVNEDEVDVNDNETVLIRVHVFDIYENGRIVIGYFADDHLHTLYEKEIENSDIGTIVNLTQSELNLEVGSYEIIVGYCSNDEEDENNFDPVIYENKELNIVDNTKFRAKSEAASIFNRDEEVFFLYCPESYANANISITVNNDYSFIYSISPEDAGNYTGFTLNQLNISDFDNYPIDIYDENGKRLMRTYVFEFENPFIFSELCIIDDEDPSIVSLNVPKGFDEGNISITDENGTELFNAALSDMEYHPHFWDENIFIYNVYYYNLTQELEVGNTYKLYAHYIGDISVESEWEVRIAKRNIVKKDGVSIELFSNEEHNLNNEYDNIAEVNAPNDEGYVNVTISREGFEKEWTLNLDEDEGEYWAYVNVYDLDLDIGSYLVNVTYYDEDGNEVLSLSGNVSFNRYVGDPEIFIEYSDWDGREVSYGITDDNIIHIYPKDDDIDSIRIIVKIGDEEYINATLVDLNLKRKFNDEGDEYYTIGAPNFERPIGFGHYSDVVAYYISDNYQKNSLEYDDRPDYMDIIGILEEIDCNDTDTAVIAVLCSHEDGQILIHFNDDEDKEPFIYNIQPGDKGNFIYFNLAQLNLTLGDYYIEIRYDDDDYVFDGGLSVVDKTKFYAKTECGSIFDTGAVFYVNCPEGSAGRITLSGDGINQIEHTISAEDQGKYIGFTLGDFGINEPGNYRISLFVDDEFIDKYELEVPSPMDFNGNGIAVISDEKDDGMKVVGLNLPADMEGNVTITVDGNQVFNKDLSEISFNWDDDHKYYIIYTCDLDQADEGTHTVAVSFANITETRTISFNQRNIKEADGVSIEMFAADIQMWDWDGNVYFAIITAPTDTGYFRVFLNDKEYEVYMDHIRWDEIWDDEDFIGYKYYINPNSAFDDKVGMGTYNVTIVYFDENDNEIVRNNDTLTLFRNPEVYICWTGDNRAEYRLTDDNAIHIYPYGHDISSVRIVVEIGDEVYLDDMLVNLNLTRQINDNGEEFYTIGPVNFNKNMTFGHYDKLVAYYYSDDYEFNTIGRDWDPNFIDIVGMVDEIEITDLETTVIAIKCYQNQGQIIIYVRNNTDGQDLSPIIYDIDENDKDEFIFWKINQLGLDVGDYYLEIKYDNDDWILNGNLLVVDKSKFYAKAHCDWFYTTDDVLWVWCPENGEGTISIEGENIIGTEHVILEEEKGTYIGFTLSQLGITFPSWYNVVVNVSGQKICDLSFNVPNPIERPNYNIYLPEEGYGGDYSTRITRLTLPSDASGNITITIDGIQYFNKNLEDLEGELDGSKVIYSIYTSNLDDSVETGMHEIAIIFNDIQTGNFINFLERNSKSQDGISIVILDGDYHIWWGDAIAEIIAPANANGKVVVKIDGVEAVSWDELGWMNWERYDENNVVRLIYQSDLGNINNQIGKYNITVTYYFDDENSTSNTGNFTLMGDSANQVGMWDYQKEYYGLNDYWFHFNSNGQTGRIVLTVDGEVALNKTFDELDYIDEWGDYVFAPVNTTVGIGRYNDVTIAFYSDNDYSYQIYRVENGATIIWGRLDIHVYQDEINMWENIAIISAPKEANGTLVFKIKDEEYFRCNLTDVSETSPDDSDENYCFYFLFITDFTDAVTAGHYDNITIEYYGDDGYNTSNLESWEPRTSVSIWDNSKINMDDFEFVYGTTGNVTINVTGGTIEKENINIDGYPYAEIDIVNGVITISGIDAGSYTLKIRTTPDEYYYSVDGDVHFNVTCAESNVEFSNEVVFNYGESDSTNVTLTGANGFIAEIIGHEGTVSVEGFVITVSGLDVGTYNLTVTSQPDDNHNSVVKNVTVTVNAIDSAIEFNNDVVFNYGESGSTNVTLTGANGFIAEIAGHEGTVSVEGFVITVSGLDVGTYNLTVTSQPDDNHNLVVKNVSVTVNAVDSDIEFSNDVVFNYGESNSTTVTLTGATGFIAEIIGHEGAVTVNDNVITVSGLDVGFYNLTVTSQADGNHNSIVKNTTVTVNAIDSSIEFSNDVVFNYGESNSTTVTLTGATGFIAEIIGHEGAVTVNDNVITVSGLDVGSYNLTVTTQADGNHKSVVKNVTVTVNAVDSTIEFSNDVVFNYGESNSTTVTLTDATGFTAEIIGHEGTVTVNDSVITVSGLDVGTYNLTVTTQTDDNHNPVVKNVTVKVNAIDSSIEFSNDVIFNYGESNSTTVILTGADTFTAEIIGHEGTVTVNDSVITVSGLDVGTYNLTVTTQADGNHNSVVKNVTVTVNAIDSSIEFSNDVVFNYGKSGSTTVILTGANSFTAEIIGHEGTVTVNDNVIIVFGLDVGSYNLTVTTQADGNHNSVVKNVSVTVNEVDIDIEFSNEVVFNYGESNSTTVTLTGADTFTAEIIGHEGTVTVEGFVITVSGLDVGTYNLTVTAQADGNHKSVVKNVTVTVNAIDSTIEFSNDVIFNYGESNSTTVTLTGATGFIAEIIGHEDAVNVNDHVITVSGLDVGTYNLTVTSQPDDNHNSVVKNVTVTVNAIDSTIEFSNDVIFNYGESNSTTVTLTGADTFTAEIIGHENVVNVDGFVITVSGLDVGSYNLTVTTQPDDNHKSVVKNVTVTVNAVDSAIEISNDVTFNYGESNSTTVTLTGATGFIAEIIGHEDAVNVNDFVITVSNLDVGTYNLTVTTQADDNHNSVVKNVTVTVNAIDSAIEFSSDIVFNYGESNSTTVTLTGATGFIAEIIGHEGTVSVDGFVITVSGLDVGTYNLTVTTQPDDNHNSVVRNVSVTVKENVIPAELVDPALTISINDISIGENAIIAITTNDTFTGNVSVKIGNDNYTVSVANGTGSYSVSGLGLGDYTAVAVFAKTDIFNASTKNTTFKVTKVVIPDAENAISLDPDSANANNPSYSIKLPANATGNLTVSIAGKTFTEKLVNGSATVKVTDVSAGTYEAVIKYSGDDYYSPITKTVNATIKVDPVVKVNKLTILYTANSKFEVTVYGTDGNVAANTQVVIKIEGKKVATVKTNSKGVATYNPKQTPGTYKISATALGKTSTTNLVVKHILTLKKVKVKKSAKKLVLKATLKKVNGKYLKGKKITFKFNGKKYKAKTNKKGVAKVTIPKKVLKKLKVGKKVKYQATYLKDTIKKTVKVKK